MEEIQFKVTNYDVLIFFKLICLLKYKLLFWRYYLSVLRGYLLNYVGICGGYNQNTQKGGSAFSPGGHTESLVQIYSRACFPQVEDLGFLGVSNLPILYLCPLLVWTMLCQQTASDTLITFFNLFR